jgi:hypothetical protein
MITCFIRTEFLTIEQNLTVLFFLLIPFGFIFYSMYIALTLCLNKRIKNDSRLRNLYLKYLTYICVYLVVNIPMISLYIISIKFKIEPGTFLGWLSFVSCILAVSAAPILCVVRLIQGYIKLDICSLCRSKKKIKHREGNMDRSALLDKTTSEGEFQWLENNIIKNVYNRLIALVH